MNQINLQVTPVWHRNWQAIHAVDPELISKENPTGRKYRYFLNRGTSRSSKTYSLIDVMDMYARTNKNKRLTVWRDTKKSCKDTVLSDAKLHFKKTGRYVPGNFNITDSVFKYPAMDSTFEIHGTDDEVTVHGLTQDVAWLNEPYKISRTVFDQIDQRTSDFLMIDLNPKMGHWTDDLANDPRCLVIHSSFKDNPFCPPEQKAKILSYQPVSMCDIVLLKNMAVKDAREYDIIKNPLHFTGEEVAELFRCRQNEHQNSASEFNWSVYGLGLKAEKPNRIFNWKPITLAEYKALDVPEYFYSDWGAVDPWAVGGAKYYDGALYFNELNYESENIIRAGLSPEETAMIMGEEEGLVKWRFTRMGVPYDSTVVCDPNRKLKILALRAAGWEYAIAALKPPGSIADGIDLLSNMPVYYTSTSKNIGYEQENYSRQIDRYGVILEEPEDYDNHHMDGARYIATFLQAEGVIRKI